MSKKPWHTITCQHGPCSSILTTVVICEEKSCIGMVMNDYEAAYALAISSWLATDSNYADCI